MSQLLAVVASQLTVTIAAKKFELKYVRKTSRQKLHWNVGQEL